MNFLKNLSTQQKLIIGGGLGAVILIVLVLVVVMSSGKKNEPVDAGFVTLYAQMSPKEAGEAAGKLKEEKIEVKLQQDGTALAVPKEKVDEARIALAMAGLPKDGVKGFEIFDKKDFMSTDFDKRVSLQRAINGELTRLVKKIEGVEDAAVYVNMPEDQIFAQERKPTTATVMIKMANFQELKQNQVEGIAHMVASAVPGLNTDNVTITDQNGALLSGGFEANAGTQADRQMARQLSLQMQLKQQMEGDVETRLTSLLDKLLGPGKSVVRVAIELDFNKRIVRSNLLRPVLSDGRPLPNNRTQSEESVQGGQSSGQPGASSNVPSVPNYPGVYGGGGNQTSKKNTQESMAFDRQEELFSTGSGNIKRMSIAVLVQGIKAERLDTLRQVIAAAAGADDARRDLVTVQEVTFDSSRLDEMRRMMAENKTATKKNTGKGIGWGIVWGVGGSLLLAVVLLAALRRMARKEENPFDTLSTLGGDESLPMFDQGALAFDQGQALPGFDMSEMQQMIPQQPMADPYADMSAMGGGMGGGMSGGDDGPFNFLYEVAPETIAEMLSAERPATAAGVLAQLDPNFAEAVVTNLPPDLQGDVYNRMSQNPTLPSMTQRMISQTLKRKLGVQV